MQFDALTDTINRLRENQAILRREGIAGFSVFCPVLRGDAREDSDVDLLIEPAADVTVDGLRLVRWKRLMSELLGRDADVVVRDFLDETIREAIEHNMIVVFERNE